MTAVLATSHDRDPLLSSETIHIPTKQSYFSRNDHHRHDLHHPHAEQGFLDPSIGQYFAGDYVPSPPSSTASTTPSTLVSSPELSHGSTAQSPYASTTTSSISLGNGSETEDEGIVLPAYEALSYPDKNHVQPTTHMHDIPTPSSHTDPLDIDRTHIHHAAADDTSINEEPDRHVDYLSHEWREEDIWASWRYVVSRRKMYSNAVRLENASWRTWTKSKYRLRTVSPETLNWLKDCDVTWLYGPLQTDNRSSLSPSTVSPPPSRLSSSNSFLDKKPILKKKTASETILQRSLTQNTLLKHAGAILQAQKAEPYRARPTFERATSDMGVPMAGRLNYNYGSAVTTPANSISSGLVSPSERRHIHFNNEVVQCIAVEAKDLDDEEGEEENDPMDFFLDEDDDTSDDGVVMMKQFPLRGPISSNRSTPRSSFSGESKTIAPLPPTTLKYRGDTPEPPANLRHPQYSRWPNSKLSPSPSVETLRPPHPDANFLLDDDDNNLDLDWQPNRGGYHLSCDKPWFVNPADEEELEREDSHLHRTSSGMFMPYEDGESANNTLFGKVVDTVNTARDIAHVIWNVGWRR